MPDETENPDLRDAEIQFRELTRENYPEVLKLEVREDQQKLVAHNWSSVAQAHFHDEAYFRGIYAGDTPVGFFMLEVWSEQQEYGLWRFMIDQRYQRQGLGRKAMEKIIAHVRTLPGATEFFTSHVDTDGNPGPFYEKLGFAYTGEVDGTERIMKMTF